MDEGSSEAIAVHQPCPHCGSSDAAAHYDDNHSHCFACGQTWTTDETVDTSSFPTKGNRPVSTSLERPKTTAIRAIPARKLTADTCKKFGYFVDQDTDEHWATYCNEGGSRCAYKVRTKDKGFRWEGQLDKKAPLFGQQLWSNTGAKIVCVTEGEIDAMSVSQSQGHKWPVVSVPNGATSAPKDVTRAITWLSSFDKIVLFFDQDKPGREAAEKAAGLLPPGKVYIAKVVGAKDANDLLVQGRHKDIGKAIHEAQRYMPGGIVELGDDLDDLDPPEITMPWSHQFLTDWNYGRRWGEVYGIGSATGNGKSDFLIQEMAHTALTYDDPIAIFNFESGPKMTRKLFLSKLAGYRFHVPDGKWTDEDLEGAKKTYRQDCSKVYINDSRGVADWDDTKTSIRYLVRVEGVRHVVLDNLTALVDPSAERESLETIMGEMVGLAEELDIIIYYISHLTTPETGSHEEGARVTIRSFKGARAIGFWSHFMLGIERDQQNPGEPSLFRCLKCRIAGENVGRTQHVAYDPATGVLTPTDYSSAPDLTPEEIEAAVAAVDSAAFKASQDA